MTVLSLVAQIDAEPGKEPELEAALRELVEHTRAEPGCINYDLHQGREQPRLFVLYENWESVPLWEAHMAAPHLVAFKARTNELIADLKLFQLTRIA